MALEDGWTLPSPPLVETVMGVQFDDVPGLSNALLGAFWAQLGKEKWPTVSDAPTLANTFERFEEEDSWRSLGSLLQLTNKPQCRIQIRNDSRDRMIQVQNGRLHHNWLKSTNSQYPRYKTIRPEFDRLFNLFCNFLRNQGLNPPRLNQWELTYVNCIPKGSLWNSPRDWNRVLSLGVAGPEQALSCELESIESEWHLMIPRKRGRVHVQLARAKMVPEPSSGSEPVDALRMALTARGPINEEGGACASYGEGLDTGRAAMVQTFREITSESAHAIWGLKNGDR